MEVLSTVQEVRAFVKKQRNQGKSIGFVPTMGALHEGHLQLMRSAKEEHETVIISIFVNPTQFGQGEDFAFYPRDFSRDRELAQGVGVDAVFYPEVAEIYPPGFKTYVNVEALSEILCGRSRQGHFRGVATVVAKLLNIVQPDTAYFGQKDAQQATLIMRMVQDLNIPVVIRVLPTVREADGLAMSSRNVYLSSEERKAATVLHRALMKSKLLLSHGEMKAAMLVEAVRREIEAEPLARIDYVEIRDAKTLEEVDVVKEPVLVAVAVFFGATRLIDNIVLGVEEHCTGI
ncbi:MAG: pantoate--beta-alanine ligase [Bacillota bacterium]